MVESLIENWGFPEWMAYLIAATIPCVLLLHVVAVGALFFIWLERKVSGRIQDRLGPTRVGGKYGWLQSLADGVKLISKEDLVPAGADSWLFRLAPYISVSCCLAAYLTIPFAYGWVAQNLDVAVFFVLAILGLEVFGVILAGYASGSKWSLLGGMREAAQVVSYEVPLGLCVVLPVMLAGSMNLTTIAQVQSGWFTSWLIFYNPFLFVTFWIFFTCALASVNRAPFDLAEAESELVAGFHTEYSGLRWSLFFLAEYGSMFSVSALAVLLFLGGWNGPIPITSWIGWTFEYGWFWGTLGNFVGLANFIFKCSLGIVLMMWVRWTLPRLRIDQVMTICLKYCLPLVCLMLLGNLMWPWIAGPPSASFVQKRYEAYQHLHPEPTTETEADEETTAESNSVAISLPQQVNEKQKVVLTTSSTTDSSLPLQTN
ncbi:NADH-ubiquinone oxidoreductase chain H [Planctomycetales bacterium 10988]|nr:NADH-ubiquinone oxidoreductase chain H [Planctomycetales bacterium 10988]